MESMGGCFAQTYCLGWWMCQLVQEWESGWSYSCTLSGIYATFRTLSRVRSTVSNQSQKDMISELRPEDFDITYRNEARMLSLDVSTC